MVESTKPTDIVEQAKEAVGATVDKTRRAVAAGLDAARERLGDVSEVVDHRLHEARRGAEKAAERAGAELRRGAEAASSVAQARAEVAKEGLKRGYDRVRKDLGDASGDLDRYVRDNPGRAVLFAAAIGFVIGLLARRR